MSDDLDTRIREALDYSAPVDITHVLDMLDGDLGVVPAMWWSGERADQAGDPDHPYVTAADLTWGYRPATTIDGGRAEDYLTRVWDAAENPGQYWVDETTTATADRNFEEIAERRAATERALRATPGGRDTARQRCSVLPVVEPATWHVSNAFTIDDTVPAGVLRPIHHHAPQPDTD